jgi:hypothetical protein
LGGIAGGRSVSSFFSSSPLVDVEVRRNEARFLTVGAIKLLISIPFVFF